MKIVIDITEDDWRTIRNGHITSSAQNSIYNGIPLPKGHGDLIDSNILCEQYEKTNGDIYQALDLVPTIIEANKESEE